MRQRIHSHAIGEGGSDPGPPEMELRHFLAAPTEQSFAPVCRWLSARLMGYFVLRGCDDATAEELTQDVLFAVYRQSATLRAEDSFVGWAYAIARNCLLQRLRFAKRRVQLVGFSEMTEAHLLRVAPEPDGASSDFRTLIAGLDEEDQEILTLRFVEGLNYREIARALHIPVGTAKWRVFASKLKLSDIFGNRNRKRNP